MTALVTNNNSLSDQRLLAMGQRWRSVAHTRAIGRKFSYGELDTLIGKSHLANHDRFCASEESKKMLYSAIQEVALNPQKFKGKSHSISRERMTHLRLKTLWIEMSPYGKRIDLLFVPPNQEWVAGTYQQVDNALLIEVPLILNQEGTRPYKYAPYVLKTINSFRETAWGDLVKREDLKELKAMVLPSIRKHEELQKIFAKNKEVKIPPCPRQKNPSAEDGSQVLEWRQPWYPCLSNVIGDRGIPLDFLDKNNKTPISLNQIMGMATNILQMLKTIFYQKGLVHSDVKCDNILINEEIEPLIIDFDILEFMGKHTGSTQFTLYETYTFWDPLAKTNIKTPLLDIHGLLISLMRNLFESKLTDIKCLRNHSICLKGAPHCLNNEKFSENILKSLLEKAKKLQTAQDKNIASSVFHLAREVHKDSFKTYTFLQENLSLRLKIKGNDKQAKKEVLAEIDKCLLTEEEITLYSTDPQAAAELKNANFPFIYLQKIQSKLKAISSTTTGLLC